MLKQTIGWILLALTFVLGAVLLVCAFAIGKAESFMTYLVKTIDDICDHFLNNN